MSGREHLSAARGHLERGDATRARAALTAAVTTDAELSTWLAADRLLRRIGISGAARELRVAMLSSHTGGQLTSALRAVACAHGLHLSTWESNYRTFEQEVLDPGSALYAFTPDVVVLAVDQREAHLPELSSDPEGDLALEVQRWREMWSRLRGRSSATILQLTFVPPLEDALGQHGGVHPGGRRRMLRRLNLAMGEDLPEGVHLVDLEAVAMRVGQPVLADPVYWMRSKHAIGLGATTTVASAIADVIAGSVGTTRKVVVVDLDNTLWGGVIGEDGLSGISLGDGPTGEAYVAMQAYLAGLKQRGLLLAVSSKNNPAEARLPFERHPDMALRLEDFVAFEASWDPKPQQIARIADELGLGLESVVFVDDNPAERAAVRDALPAVGVVELPREPSGYVSALAAFPGLQTVSLTEDDARRTSQYHARAQARTLQQSAGSREDYLHGLQMRANIEALSDLILNRVVQLIGKTNQFNFTNRRPGSRDVLHLDATPGSLVRALRLTDRFDDHGLVSVLIAIPDETRSDTLVIDTFVMSCRVLGRSVEQVVLADSLDWAAEHGYRRVVGHFIPSGRNVPAAPVMPEAGFREISGPSAEETDTVGGQATRLYEFVLDTDTVVRPVAIEVHRPSERTEQKETP